MKYYIKTFGCQMNFSDSERLVTFLESNGFQPARKIDQADLAIFNTCGVRQTAEDRVYGQVHNLRLKNKKTFIVITGCLSLRKDVQRKLKNKVDLFFAINNFQTFEIWLIENLLSASARRGCVPDGSYRGRDGKIANCKLKIAAQENIKYLSILPKYANTRTAFVPIMTGCNNFCSYCVVPYARGREWSRPRQDIEAEIEHLAQNKCQEVILLGQNVNSYKDNKSVGKKIVDFPVLLDTLAKKFPLLTFRFLTSHPKDFSEKLMKVIARHKNISKEIHLPIQSGSDKILKAMNRPYTQKHYLGLIEKAQKIIPGVSFSTDVIVGFPGETEADFAQTKQVFEKINFYEAFINKYSPRPGTAAFKLVDNIPWAEKKRREKCLRQLISAIS